MQHRVLQMKAGRQDNKLLFELSICHLLGSQQVLVFEDGPLQIDDPLRPQGYLQHPPHLNIHFSGAQDHHVVVL